MLFRSYTLLRSAGYGVSVLFNHNFNSAEPDFASGAALLSSLSYSNNLGALATRDTQQGLQKFIHLSIPPTLESKLQLATGSPSSSSLQPDTQ